jgi:hypothetical protein
MGQVLVFSIKSGNFYEHFSNTIYSQTFVQRPPMRLKKSGCCSTVAVIQRLGLEKYYQAGDHAEGCR